MSCRNWSLKQSQESSTHFVCSPLDFFLNYTLLSVELCFLSSSSDCHLKHFLICTLNFFKAAQLIWVFCFSWLFWSILHLVAGIITQPKNGTITIHFQVVYKEAPSGPIIFTVWHLGLGFAAGTVSTMRTLPWNWASIPNSLQYNIINIWQRWLHTEPHVGAFSSLLTV